MGQVVQRLLSRIRRLKRLAAELQDLAVDLSEELAIVRHVLSEDAAGRLEAAIECAVLRAAEKKRNELLRAAGAGIQKIDVRPGKRGGTLVRIDEGSWFPLTKVDGRLLGILMRATRGVDGFPGWLTYDEIGALVAQKAGAAPTHRAIVEAVYRIRRAFKSVDVNKYAISVDQKGGRVRLLMR